MNPVYSAAIAAALGRRLHCPACGKVQIISTPAGSGRRYRCKKCLHLFTARELQATPTDRE